jgi:hypothetical protein
VYGDMYACSENEDRVWGSHGSATRHREQRAKKRRRSYWLPSMGCDCERSGHWVETGYKQVQIFTHKRPGFSTIDDVFFLRHFFTNCSESLVMDGIRLSMRFYPKTFGVCWLWNVNFGSHARPLSMRFVTTV